MFGHTFWRVCRILQKVWHRPDYKNPYTRDGEYWRYDN